MVTSKMRILQSKKWGPLSSKFSELKSTRQSNQTDAGFDGDMWILERLENDTYEYLERWTIQRKDGDQELLKFCMRIENLVVDLLDSISTSFPLQIENEKGEVVITSYPQYLDYELIANDFVITLKGISNYSLSKQINKHVLMDRISTLLLKDSINSKFIEEAVLQKVEFDFVRSNTLYFKAALLNPIEGKEILGRFNLFYRTAKKGTVYGWITDEVREISE